MPRPRLYANGTERSRAHRQRQKERAAQGTSAAAPVARLPFRVVDDVGRTVLDVVIGPRGPLLRLFAADGRMAAWLGAGLTMAEMGVAGTEPQCEAWLFADQTGGGLKLGDGLSVKTLRLR